MAADPTSDTLAADSLHVESVAASQTRAVIGERYELLGLVGSGGMGNVYRARDVELDEIVALKVLRPELVGAPGALDRFRSEVRLARRVTHPNVARVFDIGERGGEKFLTMELIEGESLGTLLARQPLLPIARVVEVVSGICAGLAAAHAAGVVHRDLKPDNVLVEPGGRVVVTDFGIARTLSAGDPRQTGAGIVGTPAYMAPEQVESGAGLDERADLYALGCMLFELCTGERPWNGDSVLGVAVARLLKDPPDSRVLRPDLPAALALLVLRCMARRPEDRPASAAEVAGVLQTLTLPAAVSAVAVKPLAEAPREARDARKRVAVLPFRNGGPADQAYLAEGLTEDLIDLLSESPHLRVTSRGVVMAQTRAGQDRDPRELGRELDVHAVVEGSLRRTAVGVRISTRLVSVADGFQLWAGRFDRPEAELLALSDDTARAISEALLVEIGSTAPRGPDDPRAMDLYLRARAAYHRFFADTSGESARLFEQALSLAPDDPRILAGYAMARARAWSPDPGTGDKARLAAERAVSLSPALSEAHLGLGAVRYQSSDECGAVRSLRRAIELSAGNAGAHDMLGRLLADAGTAHRAIAARHMETALSLDPELQLPRLGLGRLAELCGDPEATDRHLAIGGETLTMMMGRLSIWRRDVAGAAKLLPTIGVDGPAKLVLRSLLDMVATGKPPYDQLAPFSDRGRTTIRVHAFFAQLEAEAAAFLGHHERALDAIERADRALFYDLTWMEGCPVLGEVRQDPRFRAVHDHVAARATRVIEAYNA